MNLRHRFAYWLAARELDAEAHRLSVRENLICIREDNIKKRESLIEPRINERVADIVFQMNPWEPLFRKYKVVFSGEYGRPEDGLDSPSRFRIFSWAYGQAQDPSFLHLAEWIQNVQGNLTITKGSQDREWDYGRACIATMKLFVEEVGRLASRYEDVRDRTPEFDPTLAVEA